MKYCTNCGEPNEESLQHCSGCGNEIARTVPAHPTQEPVSGIKLGVVAMSYVAAYIFTAGFSWDYCWEALVVFALTVFAVELLNKGRPCSRESYVWLGCFAICCAGLCFHLHDVWEDYQTEFFAIVFGVWWTLSRSGKLMENRSGHLLPADAITGFFALPFPNFFLRVRTIIAWGRSRSAGNKEKRRDKILWTASATLVCLLLFALAVRLLMQADAEFNGMLGSLIKPLRFELSEIIVVNLIFSLPLGCLGCGLILACASEDRAGIDARKERIYIRLSALRRVPKGLWIGVICLFSVLYVAFFILQGSYLFGAFVGKLPEGFIVAEYARQGFFEMCKVMVVNYALLWLATRMVNADGGGGRVFRIFCLVLLAESLIFSLIAFSKLALYISVYGFTPLRLQSTWLVCVLFAACLLWAYTIITDRPVFRAWMIFGAVTLSLLTLI